MMKSVNRIFLRRSGVLNARPKAVSTGPPEVRPGVVAASSTIRHKIPVDAEAPGTNGTNAACRRAGSRGNPGTCPAARGHGWVSGGGRRTARRLDLLLGAGGERVGRDIDGHRDLTAAEHLHELPVADRALGDQVLDAHVATLRVVRVEPLEVHDLVLGLERVLEAAKLREPHVQRGGTTLEALRHLVPGLGALGTTTGGLATAPALTTTHADLGGLRTRRGAQVVHLQCSGTLGCLGSLRGVSHVHSTSSTATRWVTVLTIPRISGRSSLTTTSPMRFRPRLRSVSRWFCLPPISERVWVTLRRAITHQPSQPGPRPYRRHGP